MPKVRSWDRETLRELVAVLSADGRSQSDIARAIKVSQATVARLAKEATSLGLLVQRQPVCTLPSERVDELRTRVDEDLSLRLASIAGRPLDLQVVTLSESVARAQSAEGYFRKVQEFGVRVAPYLARLLSHGRLFGVTWGLALQQVIEGLRRTPGAVPRPEHSVRFVPVSGDPAPTALPDARRSSSHLVADLDDLFNGKGGRALTLAGVTAHIPARFSRPEDVRTIREFIRDLGSYREIFGDESTPALLDQLDGVLTSVGPASLASDPFLNFAADDSKLRSHLERSTVGNIGGVFLERKPASREQVRQIEEINERWTGIRLEHLTRCAQAATKDPRRVGVVVVAVGDKAEIVLECLRRGLVNRLLIDRSGATALKQLLTQ